MGINRLSSYRHVKLLAMTAISKTRPRHIMQRKIGLGSVPLLADKVLDIVTCLVDKQENFGFTGLIYKYLAYKNVFKRYHYLVHTKLL